MIDLIEACSNTLQEVAQLSNDQGKQLGLVIYKAKTQPMYLEMITLISHCHCCSSKSRLVLPSWFLHFWYRLTWVVPGEIQNSRKMIMCMCDQPLKIDDYTLKNVTQFTYLCKVFTYDKDCSQDLQTRIGKATEVTKSIENTWKVRTSPTTQKHVLDNTAFNTVLYGCETKTCNKKIR